MSEDIRKMIDKVKNFKQYINEEKLNENDIPPSNGKKILFKLTDDDYSYVPSELKYLSYHTDRNLLGKYLQYTNEDTYKNDITNLEWFFIYYNGKRYIYNQGYKSLKDSSDNTIISKKMNNGFNEGMNQIIDNTLNQPKTIDIF